MQTNKAQTMYKASWKEENPILDEAWFKCSNRVKVSMENGLAVLDNIDDDDRPIVKKLLAEAGCDLIEIIDE